MSGQLRAVVALFLDHEPLLPIAGKGGWMGSVVSWDVLEERKIPCSCCKLNPDSLIIQLISCSLYQVFSVLAMATFNLTELCTFMLSCTVGSLVLHCDIY